MKIWLCHMNASMLSMYATYAQNNTHAEQVERYSNSFWVSLNSVHNAHMFARLKKIAVANSSPANYRYNKAHNCAAFSIERVS